MVTLKEFSEKTGPLSISVNKGTIVSGPTNQTAQSGGGGQENGEEEKKKPAQKKQSGPENVEVAVGETAELRDRTLVVNEVERNYFPPTRFSRVEPGNELVRVYITLKNTGNQQFAHNPNNFEMQDSNGVQRSPTGISQLPYRIEHGDLAPGGTLEGNLVYEVPEGDRGLSLVYEPFEHRTVGTVTVPL